MENLLLNQKIYQGEQQGKKAEKWKKVISIAIIALWIIAVFVLKIELVHLEPNPWIRG